MACSILTRICSLITSLFYFLFVKKSKSTRDDVILITGGGRGIGKKIALLLADRHPKQIILLGRNDKALRDTSKEIQSKGVSVSYMVCDVSEKEEIFSKARKIQEDFGDVTILVNNAGTVDRDSFLNTHINSIENVVRVNIMASMWTCKAFLPAMVANKRGHLVFVNSLLGLMGVPHVCSYVSSKYALTGFCEALRDELKTDSGIVCTSVHPYHINNDMFKGIQLRFPFLFSPLDEDYVAMETVEAILKNKCIIVLPRFQYITLWIKSWAPVDALQAIMQFTHSDKAMRKQH